MTQPKSSDIRLSAELHTEMFFEMEDLEGRFKCVLIGLVEQKFLIFKVPDKLAESFRQHLDRNKIQLKVRGLSRGAAFGFITQMLQIITDPCPILFVEFPRFIQHQTIRKSRRVKCLLPAKFAVDTTAVNGIIADISTTGCHFQAQKNLTDRQSELVKPESDILLSFQMPGKQSPITLEAEVRNTFVDDDTVHIGIQFTTLDSAHIKQLDEFINLSFDISPF